jgi:hypothetical protein
VGSALLPIQWEDDEEEEEESSLPPLHQKERSTSIAFYVQVHIPTIHCTFYTVELVFACAYFITANDCTLMDPVEIKFKIEENL